MTNMNMDASITTLFKILKLVNLFLCCVARSFQWLLKFILYSIIYSISILEASIMVLLQLLRIIKDVINVLFSCGSLLYYIGYSFGAFGTLFLLLGLCTYVFKFKPVIISQGQISSTTLDRASNILIIIWIAMVPIVVIFGFVKLKRSVRTIVERITVQELEADYTECICGKTRIRYFDKSTEMEEHHITEGRQGSEAGSSEDETRRERQKQSGTKTRKDGEKESSKEESARGQERGLLRGGYDTSSGDGNESSDQEARQSGRGSGRGRGHGSRGRGRGRV